MKVLIPMAGMGKRFMAAGYDTPKPLIMVDGLPVVEHIAKNFSPEDEFVFGANQDQLKKNPAILTLLNRIAPRHKLIPMPYQKEGPIGVVRKMFGSFKDEEPVIVNYCDFSWVWNYEHFKKTIRDNDCDGAVVCYRGFHPHLLGPNKYATLDADGLWMKEIREKFSWHDTKQKDWTSSGTYYFKKGSYVKKYFEAIEKRPEWKINGEFYVSQIFQLMKEDGLKIFIYEIPYMLQWGTPEDLEEYRYWSDYFRHLSVATDSSSPAVKRGQVLRPVPFLPSMTALILMAGRGKRFAEEGYGLPKPWIPFEGTTLVAKSTQCLPRASRYLFVTREEIKNEKKEAELRSEIASSSPSGTPRNDIDFIYLQQITRGQAETALAAKKHLDPEEPLLIGACDHAMILDPSEFKRLTDEKSGIDALIFTYRHHPALRRKPEMYGWVQTDADGRALKVSVKVPLAGDPFEHHAVIGAFWFRRARYFIENAEAMIRKNDRVNHEFYIDQCMNYLIQSKLRVYVFEVTKFASLGTPDDLKCYEYWERFFRQADFHPYKVPGSSVLGTLGN
ncbi:MAG: NTP transferase domain-containing protein [Candidatus Omnitrophica bacterium]|nr:NTP transferase domain-containing protein [Candidatus Omnitrophota bacterium]